jgi:uncharacterized protein YciI
MSTFAVTTAKGPRWDDAHGIREQAFFDEHAAFMDELVAGGVIVLGGPIDSDDAGVIALLAVEAPDEAAARAVFSADPWLKHHVFRLKEIRAWTIWLDGRRSA